MATAVFGAANAAQAQSSRFYVGPRVSYDMHSKVFGVGAQFGVPVDRHLELYPSIDKYASVNNSSLLRFNVDVKWRIIPDNLRGLYVGTGLNVSHTSRRSANSFSSMGLNLFVGAESMRGRVRPFGELRMGTLGQQQIAAGLNLTLGNN